MNEINKLDDVVKTREWRAAYGIPQIIGRIKTRLMKRMPKDMDFSLTALQKYALNHNDFWSDKNLIIQGSTSAGKTLLSELLILDVLHQEKKAIVLVPLKAMVHERTQQFKCDIEHSSNNYHVFASSSDYLDNDERLIRGEYSVAIIVYEKFFAMLSQPNCHILENCKMIVVDELSMLNKDERGPKLEMALEIARVHNTETRIVCLATCDCKVNHIANWLKVDIKEENSNIKHPQKAAIVENSMRPIGLDEYIILPDGTYSHRHIQSEHELNVIERENGIVLDPDDDIVKGSLDIMGYRRNMNEREQKKILLIPVIRKIYADYPDAKILVFVAAQSSTVSIANVLKKELPEIFQQIKLDDKFQRKLNSCDTDEEQKKLINELIPCGIAYHNASLSTTLREVIEEEFQELTSHIKVVVATETLTVGVNMPFDAMIIMDNRVPRGLDNLKLLTNQEYRNYIGRAGRLGQNNRSGITYLFVRDIMERNIFWNGYYQNDREIESALINADEIKQAPYYLGLLLNNASSQSIKFDEKELERLHNVSLSQISSSQQDFSSELIAEQMSKAHLVAKQTVMGETKYYLLPFGKSLAPYALSLETCKRIYWYFFSGEEDGMPIGITKEDLDSDKYLLEILYHICRHSEIEDSSTLMYPNKVDASYGAKRAVLKVLSELKQIKVNNEATKYEFWNNSDICQLLENTNIPEEDIKLQAAMRSILLFYWTQGKTINEIRKLTGFHPYTKIINGDMERLAEVASFHLDAIYRCLAGAITKDGLTILHDTSAHKAFYSLQVRVKYGMPLELIQLANKHVHGLDRSRILAFGAEASKRGVSPISMLYIIPDNAVTEYMTVVQRNSLLELLENRYHVSKFETLIEIMENDLGSQFSDEQNDHLKLIFEMKGMTGNEFRDCLRAVLQNKAFINFKDLNADNPLQIIWTNNNRSPLKEQNEQRFFVGVLASDLSDRNFIDINNFFNKNQQNGTCILIFESENDLERYKSIGTIFPLAMDKGFFALMLSSAILLQNNGAQALADFFDDTYGIFKSDNYQDVSLGNYIPWEEKREIGPSIIPKYRLLCNRNSLWMRGASFTTTELLNTIYSNENLKNFELLPWGKSLYNAAEITEYPTILFLDRSQIVHSKSLMAFLKHMQYQKFMNCMVLFASTDSQRKWNENLTYSVSNELKWNPEFNNKSLHTDTATTLEEVDNKICSYLNSWKNDGFWISISYARYDPYSKSDLYDEKNNTCCTDTTIIQKLAEKLREYYGEHHILFDQFTTSYKYFTGNESQQKSLEAYKQCDLHLIFWSLWYETSDLCKNEKEIIFQQCDNNKADLIILKGPNSSTTSICKEGTYATNITENNIDEILKIINEKLHFIQNTKVKTQYQGNESSVVI